MPNTGPRPTSKSRKSNANPKHSRCFTLYLYKTNGGRTEIRLFENKQDVAGGKWTRNGKATILKSAAGAAKEIDRILQEWDVETM
jgi:hypothetical protein